jgi:predicted nuclease with TOPRIM domain
MTFDDQLKRAFESLSATLHDELSRRAQHISDELAASVEADRADAAAQAVKQQEQLNEAAAEAARMRQQLDEALGETQRHQQRFDDLTAENAHQQQQVEDLTAERTRQQQQVDDLVAEQARQQQRVDDLAADSARQQQQVDELTAENDRHRQRFDDVTAENARQQHELEEAAAEAARLRQELETATSNAAAAAADAIVAPTIAAAAPAIDAAADAATQARLVNAIRQMDDARSLSQILDTLLTAASVEADRVAILLVRAGRYTGWRSIGFDPPAGRGEIVELPADASVIPIDIGRETVAVLRAERNERGGAAPHGDTGMPAPHLELLTRHAARCLESVTAFKAARAALVPPNGAGHSPDDAADDDASARRYAKLLVSEIKLYHEPDVLAGCRERDLTTRLGGEIARARVLYEQRVPMHIRAQTDYFRDELVRTLANGDSSLLHLS